MRTTGSERVSNVTNPPATGATAASERRLAGPCAAVPPVDPPHVPDAVNGRSNTAAKYTVYAFGWPQNRPLVTEPVIFRSPTAGKAPFAQPCLPPPTLTPN